MRNMRQLVRGVRRLDRPERRTAFEAWGRLLGLRLALLLIPVSRLRFALRPAARPLSAEDISRLETAVDRAARHHLVPMRCLSRSLCLQWMLARRGVESRLRVGVRRQGTGELEAHAWIEDARGLPLNDTVDVDSRFRVLAPAE